MCHNNKSKKIRLKYWKIIFPDQDVKHKMQELLAPLLNHLVNLSAKYAAGSSALITVNQPPFQSLVHTFGLSITLVK